LNILFFSVLHYSQTAFSKNGQPTIQAKTATNEKMGQREGFSQKDIQKVNKMYKCQRTTAEEDPSIMSSTAKPATSESGWGDIFNLIFPNSSMNEEENIENFVN
jgi:hypothetical protein